MSDLAQPLIATEDDGSKWVSLEDYQALQQLHLVSESALEEQMKINVELIQTNSGLIETNSELLEQLETLLKRERGE